MKTNLKIGLVIVGVIAVMIITYWLYKKYSLKNEEITQNANITDPSNAPKKLTGGIRNVSNIKSV